MAHRDVPGLMRVGRLVIRTNRSPYDAFLTLDSLLTGALKVASARLGVTGCMLS